MTLPTQVTANVVFHTVSRRICNRSEDFQRHCIELKYQNNYKCEVLDEAYKCALLKSLEVARTVFLMRKWRMRSSSHVHIIEETPLRETLWRQRGGVSMSNSHKSHCREETNIWKKSLKKSEEPSGLRQDQEGCTQTT